MIHVEQNDGTLICQPEQDIVASIVPAMRDTLIETLDKESSWEELVVDMKNVSKLDSIGINLMVGLLKKTRGLNKKFRVIGCSETIIKVFKLFRLEEQFTIEGKNA